ncbi:MAG: TonB-dependent receptor [Pseudoxanthomonas sp.]
MKHKQTLLSAAILTGLCLAAAQASAQEAAAQASAAQDLDAVVVTGIRGSVEKSLDVKRDAKSHVEVVTAEDIGKLPARNVADTLRELPGVNIGSASADEGGFDEADRVSLRGTNPSLTQTLVNGHAVASGDWFILSQFETVGRSVSYSLFPSEIVSSVVVNKSSQAKLVEGGSAGSVNIITRKPLDFADKFTMAGSIGTVYSDLADDNKPQLDALLNFKNDAGTFGVMAQWFSEERSLRRDGQEVFSWAPIASGPLAGVWAPGLVGSSLFEQKRTRTGGTLSIEIRPTDSLSLSLNGFYSKLKAWNFNRNYMLWGSNFIPALTPDNATVENGVLTGASWSGDYATYGVYDQIYRPGSGSDTRYLTADADWAASEKLDIKFQAGTTQGHGKSAEEIGFETNTGASGASYSLNGASSPISWNLVDAYTSGVGWIWGNSNVNVLDKEDWFAADATWFGDGVLDSIDFGLRYAEHKRESRSHTNGGPNWAYADVLNIDAYPTTYSYYPGDYANGLGGNFPTDIWQYSPEQLDAIIASSLYSDPVVRNYYFGLYGVKEKNAAAYVQANFEGNRWSGNVGLRYVRTDTTVNYNQDLGYPAEGTVLPSGAITSSAFGVYVPTTAENDYGKLLPSANLKFDISDSLVGRFAVSQTLTRPDYSALAGTLTLNDLAHSGSGGNPDLKPIVSTNFDAALEWYFAPRALLSASVFYMDMKDYVNFQTVTGNYKDMTASSAAGTDVYADYEVSQPYNTDARLKGAELAWQQPIGELFGVAANYTWADGETKGGGPLNGTSEQTWNASAFFENERFNARVGYTFRSEFYAGVTRGNYFYQDDFGTLSASVGFKINDHLSLSLDGLNLNNPQLKYYNDVQGVGHLPLRFYMNGRQYYASLRYKF